MDCKELAALRTEAKELNRQLMEQRAIARANSHLNRGAHPAGHSDYEPLLKRKLERLGQTIQRHKQAHGCED